MQKEQQLKALRDIISSAENSIRSARHILNEMVGTPNDTLSFETDEIIQYSSGDDTIIEWVFTGEAMLGPDGSTYPVPQNYASKSLLVQWSKLKAIIEPSGRIKYKIISEIPYETKVGIITKSGDRYQITTDTKVYNVLMAAVTFHKGEVGDTVSIRVPEWKDATYAVIESVLPKK